MEFDLVLQFWFHEIKPVFWFQKSREFDQQVRKRFLATYEAAQRGETMSWRTAATGRLAEVIVLDQFPRNMFRDTPRAFETDALALGLAQEAVRVGADQELPAAQKSFLYMPYMHSEDATVHEKAVQLFSQPGLEFNLDFEMRHKAIIDRFGRYPHRNAILGRASTPEEIEFLQSPGSGF